MDTILQNDDNLQGGFTYTFTFTPNPGFFLSLAQAAAFGLPSIPTILNDIAQSAPSFISSPSASWSISVDNYLNVTFTYTGDGSDVVSDVANELIQAFQSGSGDSFSFNQATSGTAGVTATNQIKEAVSTVSSTAGTAVGNVVGGTVQGVTSGVTSSLGLSGWVVIILVALGVLAYFSASTGLRVRE